MAVGHIHILNPDGTLEFLDVLYLDPIYQWGQFDNNQARIGKVN